MGCYILQDVTFWAAVVKCSFILCCSGDPHCKQTCTHARYDVPLCIFPWIHLSSCSIHVLARDLQLRQTCKPVRLPASEQSQISVPFKAMATELECFWPRTEGRQLWQVNLLTQSARAKFAELANIVVRSQDWSHWISNISQTSISKLPLLSYDVTWTLALRRRMSQGSEYNFIFFLFVQILCNWHTDIPRTGCCSVSSNRKSLISVYVPALYWWGSWQYTPAGDISLCTVRLHTGWHHCFLAVSPLWSQMSMKCTHMITHTHTAHQTHWVTQCQSVSCATKGDCK